MSQTKQCIKDLSTEERIRFEKQLLKRRKAGKRDAKSRITIRSNDAPCQLSFPQQRLWFLDRLIPDAGLYNIPDAFQLTGRLDVEALEASLNEIVARHEVLRTRFEMVDGQPVQIVTPSPVLPFEVIDLNSLPVEKQDGEVKRLLAENSGRPFDLEHGPLLRVKLLRLAEQAHVLLLTIHHIVSDGWSMGVLMRELSALYGALSEGQPSPLEALPIQYADYAVWQREWLQGEELSRQLGYWKGQLEGLAPLQLPTDRPRPAEQSFRGAQYRFEVSDELTGDLRSLAQREGVTLFMALLAAFQVLLSRYSGQDDIAVGSPIAGRNRPEIEGLIGFFVNTLVLRADLSGKPTFRELLGRVREVCLDAYDHQDLPFEKLVEELAPERDRSRQPFFGVMFVLQNAPKGKLSLGEVGAEPTRISRDTAKFDLTLSLVEAAQGLRGLIEYNTDLFEAETIARLVGHYQTLLSEVVADPEKRIGELSLLTESEREQLVVEWNDTATDYPKDKGIHELFEARAAETPGATAVVFAEQQMSYGELNAKANQLAHYLKGNGVGPDVQVAICVERSLEMVVGILGILKTGGAYVPLDPDYPQERLDFMLADTAAPVLLTQQALRAQLPGYGGEIFCLDSDWPQLEGEGGENPLNQVTSGNLAYVIYTSGSTGTPKGVMVPHHAVVRLVINTDYIQLGSSDRIAQVANCSFDAATFEIWGALLCGGQLIIIDKDIALAPLEFSKELKRTGITSMFLTTALFNQIAGRVPHAFASLKVLMIGGEAVDPRSIRTVLANNPPENLLNVYGPTENTTFTTWYPIREVGEDAATVPIGRPIANTQIYILDKQLEPVPVGVAGELYIGGDGLALGYLNRPELTVEKFIPDPFSNDPEARLYRTGDIVRYKSDGNVEFIGRVDHQIKLRGFRIELGEIEATLNQHPLVCESIVLVREDVRDQKRLTAYVVPVQRETNCEDLPGELRDFIRTKLPGHMVPSAIMLMDELPLTPNGKLDRKALPAPDRNLIDASGRRWPKDELESQLVQIWETVIGAKHIGVEDNFFELGGHSLLGVTLLFEIEKTTGEHLPLSVLFEHPTVMELANVLRRDENPEHSQVLVPVQPKGSRPPFFDVYGFAMSIAPHLSPDQPYYCFNYFAHGHGNRLVTDYNVEEIAANHVTEMRAIQPNGPYYLGGYSFGGMVAYEMAQQLYKQGERVALLALFDPTRPHIIQGEQSKMERKLSKLSAREGLFSKLIFVGERLIARIRGKYTRSLQDLKCRYYLAARRPMPPELNRVHLMDLSTRASRVYRYLPYPGHVDLFIPESAEGFENWAQAVQRGWDELSADGATIHVVQGAMNHAQVMLEPHVRVLARLLDSCLQRYNDSCESQASSSIENPGS